MKRSELKEYIREMILKEVSQKDVESAKELNKELEKTKELSDELGLTSEAKDINDEIKENKKYKKGDKLKVKLKNGKEFEVTFDSYSSNKGIAFGKIDGDRKPFSLDAVVNEAATDRFLKGAAYNLALQMRGKSASRTTLMNRLNRMPLANYLKSAELEKIVDYTMEEMGLNEAIDTNDPVLMKMRAAKMKADKFAGSDPKAGSTIKGRGFDWDKNTIKIDKNAKKLAFLKKERAQLMRDMEQEAEPEGGPIADEYCEKLNKIDAAIAKLKELSGWGGEKDVNISRDEIERRASMIKEENKKKTLRRN